MDSLSSSISELALRLHEEPMNLKLHADMRHLLYLADGENRLRAEIGTITENWRDNMELLPVRKRVGLEAMIRTLSGKVYGDAYHFTMLPLGPAQHQFLEETWKNAVSGSPAWSPNSVFAFEFSMWQKGGFWGYSYRGHHMCSPHDYRFVLTDRIIDVLEQLIELYKLEVSSGELLFMILASFLGAHHSISSILPREDDDHRLSVGDMGQRVVRRAIYYDLNRMLELYEST